MTPKYLNGLKTRSLRSVNFLKPNIKLKVLCGRKSLPIFKRLMDIGCYRGLRHRKGFPLRGATHQNECPGQEKAEGVLLPVRKKHLPRSNTIYNWNMAKRQTKAAAAAAKRKKKQISDPREMAFIKATFNNVIVTLTDGEGNVLFMVFCR